MSNTKSKIERCKYAHVSLGKLMAGDTTRVCYRDTDGGCPEINEEMCEACEFFRSKYIEYPITVSKIENNFGENFSLGHEIGCLVAVRPCGEEYENKTFCGFLLGDLPVSNSITFNSETGELHVFPHRNPAIFVPELKKIVYGCESWWHEIASVEELKEITDSDIDNTWYMRLLKDISKEG